MMTGESGNTPGVLSMTYFTFYHRRHPRQLCKEFWKATLVGLHGYTCARIISQIGAVNHTEDPVQSAIVTVPD